MNCIGGPAGTASIGLHKCKSPALGWILSDRIQLADGVGKIWLGRRNSLAAIIWELWNLVSEHFIHCLFTQQLNTRLRASAVVQQNCQYL